MTPLFAIALLIISLVGCMVLHLDLIYGLLVGMVVFTAAAFRAGFTFKAVIRMMWSGIREAFIVIGVLLLIGSLTGIWRGCGTIPLLVYYGTQLIHPRFFILFAFLLPVAISYLIGTSFGTAGTIGVVMMTLCSISGADPILTGGAVMSGIYFGDRASPASSCANLNAYLTRTDLYKNVKLMLKDCLPAALLTTLLYSVLSFLNPLQRVETGVLESFQADYSLGPLLLLPAVIVLAAPIFKINIRIAISLSILSASVLAVTTQGMGFGELTRTLLFGYRAKGDLAEVLSGGGMFSMVHSMIMIVISATFSGIFNGTSMLSPLQDEFGKFAEKHSLLRMTALSGLPMIMFSCNQTLALMLQVPLIRPIYEKRGADRERLMLDVSNTTVLFSGLIPWCLASSMPREVLGLSAACLPLAFYLYLPGLTALIKDRK